MPPCRQQVGKVVQVIECEALLSVAASQTGLLAILPNCHQDRLIASLVANIGLLAVFKCGAFAWENVTLVAGWFGGSLPLFPRIILPIDLSFHTFQAMSYTIEVYGVELSSARSHRRLEASPTPANDSTSKAARTPSG